MRVLCLLVVAVGLMLASLVDLAVFFVGMMVLFMLDAGRPGLRGWLHSVWQLKFLFAALLVLYLGFTGGQPLIADWPRPSVAGTVEGVHRTLVLVALLLAVHWLVRPVPATELAGGMAWLAMPLDRIGVPVDTAARRVALTLQAVGDLQERVAHVRQQREGPWLDRLANLVRGVEQQADDGAPIMAVTPRPPASAEWWWPAGLVAVLAALALT